MGAGHEKMKAEVGRCLYQPRNTKDCCKAAAVRREARNRTSFTALRRNEPHSCLDLGLLASRTV